MRLFKLLSVVLLALVLQACATGPKIHVDSDPSVQVANFSTFGFYSTLGTDQQGYGSILSQRLKSATQTRLQGLGYTYSETNPDVLVNFGAQLNDKLRVDTMPVSPAMGMGYYGYRGGMYGAWGGYNQTTVDQYTEGTVNIDVVDAKLKRLVWQGTAVGRVTDKTRENLPAVIDAVVGEILATYPAHVPR
jgi:hypothetical protein